MAAHVKFNLEESPNYTHWSVCHVLRAEPENKSQLHYYVSLCTKNTWWTVCSWSHIYIWNMQKFIFLGFFSNDQKQFNFLENEWLWTLSVFIWVLVSL